MTENNKPEWLEIAEADGKPEIRKASKSLPVSAVLVAALILGIGAVIGQTQNETPASAVTANAVQATPTSTAVAAVKSAVSNPVTAAAVGTAAASKLANPSIAQLPTGGGDDDDNDGEHHGRGHHEDDEDHD